MLPFLMFLIGFIPALGVQAQSEEPASVKITSPTAGKPLQGIQPIYGDTTSAGFLYFELTFGYASDSTGTWFLIAEGSEPIRDDLLTEWDTTTLTDGQYNLRLTVFFDDGKRTHFIVPDIRLRNYSPIETNTPILSPTPTHSGLLSEGTFTPTPLASASPTIMPLTATPLPANPAEIPLTAVNNSLLRGAAGAFALFALVGLYTSIRYMFRRR
jgi:hypothetical protein